MIDPHLLLTDFDATARRLARKKVDRATLDEARTLVERRRALVHEVDEMRAAMNAASKEIGKLMGAGRRDEAEAARAQVAQRKGELEALEARLRQAQDELDYAMLRIPNLPDDAAPEGTGEESNVVLRTHGYRPEDYAGRGLKPHWEVAGALGIMDNERAAKISGAMFALLRGPGARLLRALVKFGLDCNEGRYEEILPPHFVRTETFTATGHLPKFEPDAYRLRDDDLWAIPTGEVPLMSMHRDEILAEEELPRRYMAHTACFRRESGSAGKDTRGLQRLHEFHKVELVKLCTPAQVQAEFEALVADAERPLRLLGLPYRVVDLCAGDLTFGAARVYDLEVYAPGLDRWLEVSSCGIYTDFQTRRGNIRYRPAGGGKPELCCAMNGSGLATPRVWAALIEHGQQPDGSVRVPDPLVPFMGTDVIRGPVQAG